MEKYILPIHPVFEDKIIIKILRLKYLVLLYLIFSTSCSMKRDALGADNDIRVICSTKDRIVVENFLSRIFTDTIYTPEPEPYYKLKFSQPEHYNDLKRQSMVVVASIKGDNNPGQNLMEKILTEKQYKLTIEKDPIILAKDVYAKKQLFMIINAKKKEILQDEIKDRYKKFRRIFNDHFINRQSRYLINENRNETLEKKIKDKYTFEIKIPWGWELIKEKSDSSFIWIGREMPFQWISISLIDENLLQDELEVGRYLWQWPKNNYGNIKFNEYKFDIDKTNYNGTFAWRATGLWETISAIESKGGPFKSYIFYDSKTNKTYHINYLIHHPGGNKSIFMRQMDIIVKTFRS